MRVIAGSARGRRLRSPDGVGIRPTTDRIKEALFATLGPGIAGKTVLDLYAGAGGLGIEALSRGAGHATFVERARAARELIATNLRITGLTDRAEVVAEPVEVYARVPRPGRSYDLVLADPPYELGVPAAALEALAQSGSLAPDVLVVVEVSARLEDPAPPVGYRCVDARRYGDSRLLYLRREAVEP